MSICSSLAQDHVPCHLKETLDQHFISPYIDTMLYICYINITSGCKLTSYIKLWKLRLKINSIMIESQLASYCTDLMRQNLNTSIPQCLTFSPLRSPYAALPSSATSFLSPRLSSTTSPLTTVLYLSSALWIDGKYCKLYNLADRHIHVAHVFNISFLVLSKFDI